jgi:diacylglycerol kinase family enzyme
MRLLLVVNPTASSVTPRGRVVISKAFESVAEVRVASTGHRNHATELAAEAVADGTDVVVTLGGDGTLNEVAGALAGSPVRLAVLPGGSTNVFARALGLSDDPVEASGQLLTALASPEAHTEDMGLGRANGRVFVFHAGIGFDAAVVHEVEKRGHLKRWIAHPLFVLSAFRTWASYDRAARFHLSADGGPAEPTPFSIVLNRDPYTFLGERPVSLASGADFDKGLAVARFRSLALLPILNASARALFTAGGFHGDRHVRITTAIHRIEIEGSKPFAYQLDGDYIGETRSLQIEHVPRALRVIRPLPTDTPEELDRPA